MCSIVFLFYTILLLPILMLSVVFSFLFLLSNLLWSADTLYPVLVLQSGDAPAVVFWYLVFPDIVMASLGGQLLHFGWRIRFIDGCWV